MGSYPASFYESLTNPTLFSIYSGITYFVGGILVIFTPIYIYMLFKVLPNQMGIYKGLLFSCGLSTVGMAILRMVWIPVPTVPIMGVYAGGIIGSLGPTANFICLHLYFFFLINIQLCICDCLIFQFSALKPRSWISQLGNCPVRVLVGYTVYLVSIVTMTSLLLHYSLVDRNEFMEFAQLSNNQYAIELIKNQPSWIGFSSDLKPVVIAFGLNATIPNISVALFSVFLTAKICFIMETSKDTSSTVTQALQKNLFRTFLFRTINIVGLFTVPYIGTAAVIFFELPTPQLGIIFHIIMIFQAIFCLAGTLVMIKPFRVYIFRCFYSKVDNSTPSTWTSTTRRRTTVTAVSEIRNKI